MSYSLKVRTNLQYQLINNQMKHLIIIFKLQIYYVLILGIRLRVNNSIQYSIHLNPDKLVKKW